MIPHHSTQDLNAQWMRDIGKAKADPVFAAIERWRPVWAAYTAACEIEDEDACEAATDATIKPAHAALSRVYQTAPTTPAGLLAIMDVMLEIDAEHLNLHTPEKAMDDSERGLIAVFHYARRLLEAGL